MPLNLTTNDGDFTPFIKYNAKAGRWYIRVDGQEGDVEVTNPVLAFDFDNIRTGWLYYAEGVGPEKVWDPSPTVMAPKPPGPKNFKRGFECLVSGPGSIGLREFSSTAGSAISAIMEIYAIYEAGRDANKGKCPVFACVSVKPITGKHGTNYAPIFKLHSWKDRHSLPFDSDSTKNNNAGHWSEEKTASSTWTIHEALAEAAKVGITRDDLIADVTARGHTGWNAKRDTPLLKEMIEEKKNQDNGWGDEPLPSATGRDDDIPF